MLLAEIHGKACFGARNHEDYLTSAVFGHLRHVPPQVFWDELVTRALGVPDACGSERTLADLLREQGLALAAYPTLHMHFWKSYPGFGEPDLLLVFTGGETSPVVVVVEVKLDAFKSGSGTNDQLNRYLNLLNDLPTLRADIPTDSHRFLFI